MGHVLPFSCVFRGKNERKRAVGGITGFPLKDLALFLYNAPSLIEDTRVCDLQPFNQPVNCLIIKCFYCTNLILV